MDAAKMIRELREGVKMNRKEFSEHTGIPVRTLEDWSARELAPTLEYIQWRNFSKVIGQL